MTNPLINFFQWIDTIKYESVKNNLCTFVFRYLPGTAEEGMKGSYRVHKKLIEECKKLTTVYKIEGTCILFHHYISQWLNFYDEFYIEKTGKKTRNDILNKYQKELKADWDFFVKEKFNPRYFESYSFWLHEESADGSPNTRIKTLWDELPISYQ